MLRCRPGSALFTYFIVNTKTTISRIETISLGLLFPLKDKDGKSTVNIEPFYQYRQYKEYEKAYENIWGIRFSVPFRNVL